MLKKWLDWLEPFVAGALLVLAFAPFNLSFFALVAPVWLLKSITKSNRKAATLKGWLFGLGLFSLGASWIQVSIYVYGNTSFLLSIILTLLFVAGLALFFAGFTYCYKRFFDSGSILNTVVAYPSLWVLFEWLRGFILTGFPWLYVGNAQIHSIFGEYTPVLGVYGVSWVTVFVSTSLYFGMRTIKNIESSKEKIHCGFILSIALGLTLTGYPLRDMVWTTPAESPLSVSLIQANIPQELKWSRSKKRETALTYQKLTENHWGSDIVIWPENALPFFREQMPNFVNVLNQTAKQHQTTLITGIPIVERSKEQYFNGVIALGESDGEYRKQHLVPFGEYVPLESLLRGLIGFFDLPMSNFSRGDGLQRPFRSKSAHLAPSICYEIAYPNTVARMAANSEMIFTISNDTWFGQSIGPKQHVQIAQMRAKETGQYVLRATNSGITAIINPKGHITAIAPPFKQATLSGEAYPMHGKTPFVNYPYLALFFSCFGLLATLYSKNSKKA